MSRRASRKDERYLSIVLWDEKFRVLSKSQLHFFRNYGNIVNLLYAGQGLVLRYNVERLDFVNSKFHLLRGTPVRNSVKIMQKR